MLQTSVNLVVKGGEKHWAHLTMSKLRGHFAGA